MGRHLDSFLKKKRIVVKNERGRYVKVDPRSRIEPDEPLSAEDLERLTVAPRKRTKRAAAGKRRKSEPVPHRDVRPKRS